MITVEKKEKRNDIGDWMGGELVCVTSPTPREKIELRRAFPKTLTRVDSPHELKLYHFIAKGKNGDSEIVSSIKTQLSEKVAHA